jgi:uncharacterized protein YbjT (DUF2867 family)
VRVLVTGARGFLGSSIVAALIDAGHEVVSAVRASSAASEAGAIVCDMARDTDEAIWLPRLAGIDAVVNCAGILRERGADTFEAVHVAAPMALFRACIGAGVTRVVQISALGDPDDGAFIASKHRCDDALQALSLESVVLRPSVAYSTRGSYGGTSLLRALAALPWLMLPGAGTQRIQPVAVEDVAAAVVAVLAGRGGARETYELVGPNVVTLVDYLRVWRRWLGMRAGREWHVPATCVRAAAHIGDVFGRGPLGLAMWRMLERGNVGASDAWRRTRSDVGVAARSLERVLAQAPAETQDRWHARLYFWLPALRVLIALLFVASGVIALAMPDAAVDVATQGGPLPPAAVHLAARAGGVLDIVLGVLCIARWQRRRVLMLMAVLIAIYTIAIGIFWPQHWLDPLGGLVKNLPLLIALGVLTAVEERR